MVEESSPIVLVPPLYPRFNVVSKVPLADGGSKTAISPNNQPTNSGSVLPFLIVKVSDTSFVLTVWFCAAQSVHTRST